MQSSDNKHIVKEIFLAGVQSVLPDALMMKWMKIAGNILNIGNLKFDLDPVENIYIIGAGKASALMASAAEEILGDRISGGHIVVKRGHSVKLRYLDVTEAGHPVPDKNGVKASEAIAEIASKVGKDDLVICLISGGGSALLADIPSGLSLDDFIKLNSLLLSSGACIQEINAVRKHISYLKGGQLARIVSPAVLVTLILSDVPGDELEVIASGPTVPDSTTYRQALDVLFRFNLTNSIPSSLLNHLNDGAAGIFSETPKTGDKAFDRVYNVLIGTNKIALEAAKVKALDLNLNAVIVDDKLQGDIVSIADYLVHTALEFQSDEREIKPVVLLFGGETTVTMNGKGKGGRNQHLALLTSLLLKDYSGITILSAGTDGTDGPTDAAGAVVDCFTFKEAESKNLNPGKFLEEYNSYNFFRKAGGHIITGPTRTNVMDVIIVLVEPSNLI